MTVVAPKLSWCIVRLGNDFNWWVKEISDPVHWDLDCLSILDPKQVSYLIELTDALKEYGLDTDLMENAFFKFKIDKRHENGDVRLIRTEESIFDIDEPVFTLPDIIDEEKGPYADFLDHITKLRVKLLNDSIEFEKNMTAEEISDDLRERYQQEFFEGTSIHSYRELTDILEYVPDGFELDSDESKQNNGDDDDEFDDINVQDEDIDSDEYELIEKDLKWDDSEELKAED